MQHRREEPLVVPGIDPSRVRQIKHCSPVPHEIPVTITDAHHYARRFRCRPARHQGIVAPPRATPRGPSPDVCVAAEGVAGRRPVIGTMEMICGYHHYLGRRSIPFEELVTIGEESRFGLDIVLENDALFLVGEEPIDAAGNRAFASEISSSKQRLHLTRPVNCSRDRARFCTSLVFANTIGAWSVSRNV